MTGLTKTAKIINPKMVNATLNYLDGTRHPIRNRLIFLLSVKLGLRAKEIACLTWSMILDAEGDFTDVLTLDNSASKGKRGGRIIPLSQTITDALSTHFDTSTRTEPHYRIIQTERSDKVAPQVIVNMFQRWFADLGYEGCSSHSGRRTFITNASKKSHLSVVPYEIFSILRVIHPYKRHKDILRVIVVRERKWWNWFRSNSLSSIPPFFC